MREIRIGYTVSKQQQIEQQLEIAIYPLNYIDYKNEQTIDQNYDLISQIITIQSKQTQRNILSPLTISPYRPVIIIRSVTILQNILCPIKSQKKDLIMLCCVIMLCQLIDVALSNTLTNRKIINKQVFQQTYKQNIKDQQVIDKKKSNCLLLKKNGKKGKKQSIAKQNDSPKQLININMQTNQQQVERQQRDQNVVREQLQLQQTNKRAIIIKLVCQFIYFFCYFQSCLTMYSQLCRQYRLLNKFCKQIQLTQQKQNSKQIIFLYKGQQLAKKIILCLYVEINFFLYNLLFIRLIDWIVFIILYKLKSKENYIRRKRKTQKSRFDNYGLGVSSQHQQFFQIQKLKTNKVYIILLICLLIIGKMQKMQYQKYLKFFERTKLKSVYQNKLRSSHKAQFSSFLLKLFTIFWSKSHCLCTKYHTISFKSCYRSMNPLQLSKPHFQVTNTDKPDNRNLIIILKINYISVFFQSFKCQKISIKTLKGVFMYSMTMQIKSFRKNNGLSWPKYAIKLQEQQQKIQLKHKVV